MHERVLSIPLLRAAGLPSAEQRALQRRARSGDLTVLRPGTFVQTELLDPLWPVERHLLALRASAPGIVHPRIVSHATAAAVHGLPFIGPPPNRLHVTDGTVTNAAATRYFRIHTGLAPDTEPTASFATAPVRSLERTLVEVASTLPLVQSLPMIDHAFRSVRLDPTSVTALLDAHTPDAHAKARVAIGMGSALSGSPAESLCRVRFRQLRTPPVVQQHVFARAGERRADVDFWFPEQGVVVEVDGRGKYEDPLMLDGRSTADAHWREKQREDFVRSFPEVRALVRLTWADLLDPERVRAKLRRAGVPCS